jgi:SP family general alpha glucoside:H+ symporter-like MFS transporter
MTVLEAARAYPMACFWAFVMSFTIVSPLLSAPERPWLTHPFRSWNPTMYFL